jgi:anti-anti-sigma regulatory factor
MERRRAGAIKTAEHLEPSDHACWSFDSDAARAQAAVRWLADGLRLGNRAVYVANAPRAALVDELAGLPGRDDAIAAGQLVVAETRELYDLATPIDANGQLAAYAAAVDDAIANGCTGISAAVDITPLIEDPARRRAHLHWEQFADRYMTEHPLAALCLVDRRRIVDFPVIEYIHPLVGPRAAPFSLHAVGPDRCALAGEVDAFTSDAFADALATLPEGDGEVVATDLRFIDARAAWLLEQVLVRRRADGRPLAVRDASPLVRRLWSLCDFDPSLLSA